MRRIAVFVCLTGVLVSTTSAHDIPNARVDRSIQVTLRPGRLTIDYEVSLSELTLTRDLARLSVDLSQGDRRDWYESYGRETTPLNAKGLFVAVDREWVGLEPRGFDLVVEDHPRYLFHYEAMVAPAGHLTVFDTNYAESEGTSRLGIRGHEGVVIHGDELPPDVASIAIRPVWQLTDAEERRTRRVDVDYMGPGPATSPSSSVPQPAPPVSTVPARQVPSPAQSTGALRLSRLNLPAQGLPGIGLWLIALGLGALHSLQPGHGKTLVAAAVVGEHGNWLHGVILALLTTAVHTGTVLLLALGLYWSNTTRYAEVHLGLAHVAGFAIAAIGLWRLGRHLGGHVDHDPPRPLEVRSSLDELSPARAPIPFRGLIGLAIAGGLVPCWDAVVLLLIAHATGRLGVGVSLVLAFGLGMSVVLVLVGVLADRVRQRLLAFPGSGCLNPWNRRLGIAGGLTLAVIGVSLLATT